jgi:hypothetical protein
VNRNGLHRPEATAPRGPVAYHAHRPKGRGGLLGAAQPTVEVTHPTQADALWARFGAVAMHRPHTVVRLLMSRRWPPHDEGYAMSMREPRGWHW